MSIPGLELHGRAFPPHLSSSILWSPQNSLDSVVLCVASAIFLSSCVRRNYLRQDEVSFLKIIVKLAKSKNIPLFSTVPNHDTQCVSIFTSLHVAKYTKCVVKVVGLQKPCGHPRYLFISSSLKLQKRLAASVMRCGKKKVWLDPNEINEIANTNSSKYLPTSTIHTNPLWFIKLTQPPCSTYCSRTCHQPSCTCLHLHPTKPLSQYLIK